MPPFPPGILRSVLAAMGAACFPPMDAAPRPLVGQALPPLLAFWDRPAETEVEAVLKIAVANIDEAVIVTSSGLDEPGPLIAYVNPAFTRLTGYEAHEVIGTTPRILQGPRTSRPMLNDMRATLSKSQPFKGEAVNYRKDGTEYLVEWLVTPLRGSDGQVRQWVAVQRNITHRKQIETALVAKDKRLGSIVESARDYAIFVTDRKDRIVDWWAGAASVYGWSAEQALGQQAAMTFTQDDREAGVPEQEVAGAARDGIVPNVRWHLHADGYLIFIEGSVRALRAEDGSLTGFLKIGQDVTARKLSEKRLQDSESRLTRALAAARMGTWEWEAASDTLQLSAGLACLYGRPEGSIASVATFLKAIDPADRAAVRRAFEQTARADVKGGLAVQFRVSLPDGQVRWLSAAGQAEHRADGGLSRIAGVTQDITERRDAESRINYMAQHDSLTGVANREALRGHLAQAMLSRQDGRGCAVLALDLDDFKKVNDTQGHAGGDALLRSVAVRLRQSVRSGDLVARLGGDEFVVVQSGLRQPSGAETLAARIIAELGRPYRIEGHQIGIGVSIGIAVGTDDGIGVDQVLGRADLALYEAKQHGGASFRLFEPRMQARVEHRRRLEAELQHALARGEFELHYQPLVRLAGLDIVGFEALVRWRHPTRGLVQPGEFICAAEETGLIQPLGAWILAQACKDAARWPSPLRIAVNLSVRQFWDGNLPEAVDAALGRSGLDPWRLELEITETLLMRDTEETLATLHGLRGKGVSICLDDFGTGFSSLSYLAKFPFDKVKIDRSFIAASEDLRGSAIIRAIVDMCGSFEIVALAEGIENALQLRRVVSLGCIEGQGFHFARPCPAAEVAALLGRWNNPNSPAT